MAYVVAEPCIECRYTDCVEVCPVACFHGGANFLVIDPDGCIDCGACVPACPVEAIFQHDALPVAWVDYAGLNARLAHEWPVIATKEAPDPDADAWRDRPGKGALLDPSHRK